ncbi:MAG: hypothetical protein ABJB66_11965 [Gemmatimonadaceae bacterium]
MSSSNVFDMESQHGLRRCIYIAAFLLVAMPLVQGLSGLSPLFLGNVEWRLKASTAMSGVLMVPFAGLTAMLTLAKFTQNKNVARFVGAFSLLCGVVLLVADPLFVLDAFQYKSIVKSQVMEVYNRTMLITGVTMLTYTLIYVYLGLSALRSAKVVTKHAAKGTKKVAADESLGLLIGQEYGEK